jgi:hypothetical protein
MERVGLVGGMGIHAFPHASVFVIHVWLRQNQKSGLIAARKTF